MLRRDLLERDTSMKPTRLFVLLLVSFSLFGIACSSAEPEVEETEPTTEEVSPTEVEGEEMEETEEMEEAEEMEEEDE